MWRETGTKTWASLPWGRLWAVFMGLRKKGSIKKMLDGKVQLFAFCWIMVLVKFGSELQLNSLTCFYTVLPWARHSRSLTHSFLFGQRGHSEGSSGAELWYKTVDWWKFWFFPHIKQLWVLWFHCMLLQVLLFLQAMQKQDRTTITTFPTSFDIVNVLSSI